MGKQRVTKSAKDKQQFSYLGKEVAISSSGDQATIEIDDRSFQAARRAEMWQVPGVHNPYNSLENLARHMVEYIHLI